MKTTFINQLPQATQESIKKELQSINLDTQDIKNAMNSRLSDLEDTIDISKYL